MKVQFCQWCSRPLAKGTRHIQMHNLCHMAERASVRDQTITLMLAEIEVAVKEVIGKYQIRPKNDSRKRAPKTAKPSQAKKKATQKKKLRKPAAKKASRAKPKRKAGKKKLRKGGARKVKSRGRKKAK